MELNTLIVDDDQKLLSVLKSLLVEEGHNVSTCDNGLQAIKQCRESNFDLIVTDIMMPGASGLDVLKEARKINTDSLVILITGFASLETAIEAIREGAYDYITKPFKLEQIKIVVNNAGERIRLVRENERLLQELQEASDQLKMVKRIMGANDDGERRHPELALGPVKGHPLITGSMLSDSYLGDNRGIYPFLLSDLERISTLKDKGFLSKEEFDQCKSKILKNFQH